MSPKRGAIDSSTDDKRSFILIAVAGVLQTLDSLQQELEPLIAKGILRSMLNSTTLTTI